MPLPPLLPLINLQTPNQLPSHHPRDLLRIIRHAHAIPLVVALALIRLLAVRRRRIRIPRVLRFDALEVGVGR